MKYSLTSNFKYAVFGGTFDPFHADHLAIVKGMYSKLDIDFVIIIPSYNPPHKDRRLSSFEQRCEIIRLSTNKYSWIIVDTIEETIDSSKTYTYITLEKIKEKYGPNMTFVMGGDSFMHFMSWKNPSRILELAQIVVIPRDVKTNLRLYIKAKKHFFSNRVNIIKLPLSNVSSSEIRAYFELDLREIASRYINSEAFQFIISKKMYTSYGAIVNKLRNCLSVELFKHSIETANYAVKLAVIHGVEPEDALLGGLLHDYAKESEFQHKVLDDEVPIKIAHQYFGADKAKSDFNINDNVYNSIKYHSTGTPDMTELQMIIFCADKLEPSRYFEGIENLRKCVEENLLEGFKQLLKNHYEYLEKEGNPIYKLTQQTMLWYSI